MSRAWPIILLCTVLGGLVAGGTVLWLAQTSPRYTAEASIVLSGPKFRLELDPKFQSADSSVAQLQAASRADEYRTVALSGEVRKAASDALHGQIGPDQLSVDAKVRGGLISVTATAPTPAQAADIANAYAAAVTQRLVLLYGVTDGDQAPLEKNLQDATARQRDAQAQLDAFLRDSQLDKLQADLAQRDAARQTILDQQNSALQARLGGQYSALAELDRLQSDAQALQARLANGGDSAAGLLAQSLTLAGLERRLVNLTSLAETDDAARRGSDSSPLPIRPAAVGGQTSQPAAGSQQSSSSSAAQQARSNPSPTDATSRGIDLQVGADALFASNNSRQQMQQDVTSLLTAIDARRAIVRKSLTDSLNRLSGQPDAAYQSIMGQNGSSPVEESTRALAGLTTDVQALRAQIQAQEAQRTQLAQQVELATTARAALDTKLQEAKIASAGGSGVAIVASATPPLSRSYPPSTTTSSILGTLVGLTLATLGAIALAWVRTVSAQPGVPAEDMRQEIGLVHPPAVGVGRSR